jgi:plastocyanin
MRFIKLLSIVGLMAVVFAAGLMGRHSTTRAQDKKGQTVAVMAGASSGQITALVFAPAKVQIHRGDTVRWHINGFHNVHFNDKPTEFFVPGEVDGKKVTQFNPASIWPTAKNGDTYTGGTTNNGLPLGGPAAPEPYFGLTFDVAPGSYTYYCDVHPGMVGVVEVVDDATAVPSAVDVIAQGFGELQQVTGAGFGAQAQLAQQAAAAKVDNNAIQVALGAQVGQVEVLGLFPNVVVIKAGQSVTWSLPKEATSAVVAVGSLPLPAPEETFSMIPPSGDRKVPVLALSDLVVSGSVKSDSTVKLADKWFSGIIQAGGSYTLTFSEPGVYRYGGLGGSEGAVVVMQ